VFRIRPGVRELRFDSWPRIDDAIASYAQFQALKDDGTVPEHLRFQVGLPFPSSALNAFEVDFAADYPVGERALRRPRRARAGPADGRDPARGPRPQWDVCHEVLDLEGVIAWMGDGAWERFASGVARGAARRGETFSSATTSATGRSRNGRCARPATWS
jgi:hypothetical protein